jgi:hypothetical protein
MKHINIKSGLILASLLLSLIFTRCTKQDSFMEAGVVDMNDRITSIDKTITQPGDTVTITGNGLDQVYKIMLNTDIVPVYFKATSTELKLAIPTTSPLGDVITINFLFYGKGLAQRAIRIISPPVIYVMSPEAAHAGDKITIYGKELYLAQTVSINSVDVTSSLVIESDKIITVVAPTGFTGGDLIIGTASGGITTSPYPLQLGTEIMINNYDGNHHYDNGLSSNGNLDNDVMETGEFPRNNYYTFTIKDNSTGWGGNVDFYTTTMPTYTDNTKISLSVDIKLTKAMGVNVMIARGSDVWGLTKSLVVGWNTVVLPFSTMGSGYGGTIPLDMPLPAFNAITGVKIQPPASAANANFGEKISIDNIKFIIVD